MASSNANQQTIRSTCSHYLTMVDESVQLQRTLSTFASSLKTSLMLLPQSFPIRHQLQNREMDRIKFMLEGVVTRCKDRIEADLTVMTEVEKYVGKLGHEFKRVIDLVKFESDKSASNILLLEHQLRLRDKEVTDCQTALQGERMKRLQEEWKSQHYVGYKNQSREYSSATYIKVLKEFKSKVEGQVVFEKEEMNRIATNIGHKLTELKTKLIEGWNMLNLCSPISETVEYHPCTETKNEHEYTDFERQYLRTEKKADGYAHDKLNEIKRKLRFLDEAEMSVSRENFSYSRSGSRDRRIDESEVIGMMGM